MTLSELAESVVIQGTVSICQVDENEVLNWCRRSEHKTSDLSLCDIAWAAGMKVKYIYPMRDTIYIEVIPED